MGSATDEGAVAGVLHRLDLALLVDPVDQVTAFVGHQRGELHAGAGQLGLDQGESLGDALSCLGADDDRVRFALPQPGHDHRVGGVGLVDHDQLADLGCVDLREHLTDRGDLTLGVGVRTVDHVQDQVGVGHLLEGRAEGLDELVGQVAHEADGVGHRVDPAVGGRGTTSGRVQRREQRVLDQDPRVGEPVEQGRLAGVGVAGDGHRRDGVALPLGPLGRAGAPHLLELATELGDLVVDPAPVGLDLGLTGPAATDALAAGGPATDLAGQVAAPAAQSLLQVLELGQLDLRLALLRLRVLGEDVEDQRGPVDGLDLELVLEVPQLGGRELAVDDDGVGAGCEHDLAQPVDLAASDVCRRIGLLAALVDRLQHLRACRLGQQGELGHRVLGVGHGALGPDTDQDDPLEPEFAVLDLADVLELGAQAVDATQGMSFGQVLFTDGEVLGIGLVGIAGLEVVSPFLGGCPVLGGVELSVEAEVLCVRHMSTRVGRGAGGRERLSVRRRPPGLLLLPGLCLAGQPGAVRADALEEYGEHPLLELGRPGSVGHPHVRDRLQQGADVHEGEPGPQSPRPFDPDEQPLAELPHQLCVGEHRLGRGEQAGESVAEGVRVLGHDAAEVVGVDLPRLTVGVERSPDLAQVDLLAVGAQLPKQILLARVAAVQRRDPDSGSFRHRGDGGQRIGKEHLTGRREDEVVVERRLPPTTAQRRLSFTHISQSILWNESFRSASLNRT